MGTGDARVPRAREVQIAGKVNMDPKRKLRDETGSDSAGQSGDIQQLRDKPYADSESAEELLEEGNAFEAGIVSGVEDAPDADQGEVRTRQVPEDDVPEEYLNDDNRDVG